MTRRFGVRLATAVAALTCATALTACGSSPTSNNSAATTSPPPGAGDVAICQLVAKATTAYNAKDFTSWRSDMQQIASQAGSASYLPLKKYAEEVKGGEVAQAATTTTTTAPKSAKSKSKGAANVSGIARVFGTLGGYLGLQHVCNHLPAS
ncbi:MAG TPA: hypothetical protein VGF51_01135 [Acidimicrobiales bacterium]|jgi:hypothetical protein